jgi:flagellar hook-associated protein 2
MALLAQAGIASDARKPGGGNGYDVSKMRGYLEVDEDTLKKALDQHFDAVRQLFGNDTNGDLIVDSGVGFSLDALLRPYVDTGGIVAIKTGTIDTSVGIEKRNIDDLDRRIASKQEELKRKYGMMEGALSQMQGTSSAIDNFSKNAQ